MSWSKTIAWTLMVLMVLMAFAIGAYALNFFLIPEMGDPRFKIHFESIPLSARLHIIPGGLALILGAFQFHQGLRTRWTNIHRWCGRAYVIFVLAGAVGGLVLAYYAPQSVATRIGFACLTVIWFYSGVIAYLAVRTSNIALHQQWMIGSYAIVAWFSWVPNLIIAEWFFIQAPIRKPIRKSIVAKNA